MGGLCVSGFIKSGGRVDLRCRPKLGCGCDFGLHSRQNAGLLRGLPRLHLRRYRFFLLFSVFWVGGSVCFRGAWGAVFRASSPSLATCSLALVFAFGALGRECWSIVLVGARISLSPAPPVHPPCLCRFAFCPSKTCARTLKLNPPTPRRRCYSHHFLFFRRSDARGSVLIHLDKESRALRVPCSSLGAQRSPDFPSRFYLRRKERFR